MRTGPACVPSGTARSLPRCVLQHLLAVSQRGEWAGWLACFLRSVEREAGDAALRAQRLLDLRETWRARCL